MSTMFRTVLCCIAAVAPAVSATAQLPEPLPTGRARTFHHQFQGADCLTSPVDPRLDLPTGSGTIEFWAEWGGPSHPATRIWCVLANGERPAAADPEAPYAPRFAIYLTDQALYFQSGPIVRRTRLDSQFGTRGQLSHFAILIDQPRRTVRAYVDGRPLDEMRDCVLTGTGTGRIRLGAVRAATDAWDGKGPIQIVGDDGQPQTARIEDEVQGYVGSICDLRIWSRAIDPRMFFPGLSEPSPMAQRDQEDIERTIAFPTVARDSVTPLSYSELLLYSDFRGDEQRHGLVTFSPPNGRWISSKRTAPGLDASLDQVFDTGHGNVLQPVLVTIRPIAEAPGVWEVYEDADYIGCLHSPKDDRQFTFSPASPGEPTMTAELGVNGDLRLGAPAGQSTRLFGGDSGDVLGGPTDRVTLVRPTSRWMGKLVDFNDPFWKDAVQRGLLISYKGYNLRKMPATKLWMDAQGRTGSSQFVFEEPREGDTRFDMNSGHVLPKQLAYVGIADSEGRETSVTSFSEQEHANTKGTKFGTHVDVESFVTLDAKFDEEKRESERASAGEETSVTTSCATLRAYALVLDKSQARLDPRFVAAIKALRGAPDRAYRDFVEDYGTHYAAAVTYGGLLQHEYEVKKTDVTRSIADSVSMEMALTVGVSDQGMLGSNANKASAGFKSGRSRESEQKWRNSLSNAKKVTTIIGSRTLSADGSGSFTVDDPQPIFFDLRPQTELLSPAYFADAYVWEEIRPMLARVVEQYLGERLNSIHDNRMALPPSNESDFQFSMRMQAEGLLWRKPEIIAGTDPIKQAEKAAAEKAWNDRLETLKARLKAGAALPGNPIAEAYLKQLARVRAATARSRVSPKAPLRLNLRAWVVATPETMTLPKLGHMGGTNPMFVQPDFSATWWTAVGYVEPTPEPNQFGVDLTWAHPGTTVYLRKRFEASRRQSLQIACSYPHEGYLQPGVTQPVSPPGCVAWLNGDLIGQTQTVVGWNELVVAVPVTSDTIVIDLVGERAWLSHFVSGLDQTNVVETTEPAAPVEVVAQRSDAVDEFGRRVDTDLHLTWRAPRARTRHERETRVFSIERITADEGRVAFTERTLHFRDSTIGARSATYTVGMGNLKGKAQAVEINHRGNPITVAADAAPDRPEPSTDPTGDIPAGTRLDTGSGITMVRVAPGSFRSGPDAAVTVQVSRGFWLAETEVTQKQWFDVMGTRPWRDSAATGYTVPEGDDLPATFMTWAAAVAFCEALTRAEQAAGRLHPGYTYRLPREAEWEMACRAGTTTRFWFGDDMNGPGGQGMIGFNNEALAVKSWKPNPWGFHFMHGNVWEFCFENSRRGCGFNEDPSGTTERAGCGADFCLWDTGLRPACANHTLTPKVAQEVLVDDSLPPGATGVDWLWRYAPLPMAGSRVHTNASSPNQVTQHFFHGASPMLVSAGDLLFAHVFLDAANPPLEIMLQWHVASEGDAAWEHRAYWGRDFVEWGKDGTYSRQHMGPLPAAGRWVALQVPAEQVALIGAKVDGVAFTQFGGDVVWDTAGVSSTPIAALPEPPRDAPPLELAREDLRRGHRLTTELGQVMLYVAPVDPGAAGFWLADAEVTQQQWRELMMETPWDHCNLEASLRAIGPDVPAYQVNLETALAFCERLTVRERRAGRIPAGYEYSLPTQDEWETACRAGSTTKYPFGDDASQLVHHAVCYHVDRQVMRASPIRTKQANAWGFYDMLGNVSELCEDGTCRGGSWMEVATQEGPAAATRGTDQPSLTGLRPALVPRTRPSLPAPRVEPRPGKR